MNPTILAHTDAAKRFLEQIDPVDRPTALLLIESLILIDHATFEQELVQLVRATGGDARTKGRCALYAIRETPLANDPAPPPPSEAPFEEALESLLKRPLRRPHYFSAVATDRPNAVAPGAGVGSEGALANLIRNLARVEGSGRLMDHPSIHSLRSKKCRKILLVDDFIGSGTRAYGFVDAFMNHPTIRSWRSYHRIEIAVLAFAGTTEGIQTVEAHPNVDQVICGRIVANGCPRWTVPQMDAVQALCTKYAKRAAKATFALGYKDSFSLLVFEHKCPNTVPVMLWGRSRDWAPLFRESPQRGLSSWPMPDARADIERKKRVLKALGQKTLSEVEWEKYVTPQGRERLVALSALSRGFRKVEGISRYIEVSVPRCQELLRECVRLGWATEAYRLTSSGAAELDHARRLGLTPGSTRDVIDYKKGYYFPKSLRRTQGSI